MDAPKVEGLESDRFCGHPKEGPLGVKESKKERKESNKERKESNKDRMFD